MECDSRCEFHDAFLRDVLICFEMWPCIKGAALLNNQAANIFWETRVGIMAQLFIEFRFFSSALTVFSTNPFIRTIESFSAIPARPSLGNMIGVRKLTPIDTRTAAAVFRSLNMIICFCHNNSPRVEGSVYQLRWPFVRL